LGVLDDCGEFSLFVFVQALPEDHLSEGEPEVVVVPGGLLTGLQGSGNDGGSGLAFEGIAGRAWVLCDLARDCLGRRSEVLAEHCEGVSEVPLQAQRVAFLSHEMQVHPVHEEEPETGRTDAGLRTRRWAT